MTKKLLLCLFIAVILTSGAYARAPQEEVTKEEKETTVMVESKYKESPMLAERVKQNLLPPVDQRLLEQHLYFLWFLWHDAEDP